ncbi:MAG: stage III sporulation protein AA [Ruminococcus sp.]|nr:stage III sporulation protein AA [Ruminococcus sp.]
MKRIFERLNLPPQKRIRLQEIRLRVNKPVTLISENKTETIDRFVSRADMESFFRIICNDSVYSKQNEIMQGFITLKGGHRAGICGTAVYNGDEIVNIRDINSINFRIAHEKIGCSDSLLRHTELGRGILICGAPCSGKTTILRDIARNLSEGFRIAVIDSRGELGSVYKGEPQNDLGSSFVLDGYSKKDGFDHALRCLAPDYIICDEIGTNEDACSLENSINSGAGVICSAHCANKRELLSKPVLRNVVRCFSSIVFLGNREKVGQVLSVINTNELHA